MQARVQKGRGETVAGADGVDDIDARGGDIRDGVAGVGVRTLGSALEDDGATRGKAEQDAARSLVNRVVEWSAGRIRESAGDTARL